MAGFIPNSLPPISILSSSPGATHHDRLWIPDTDTSSIPADATSSTATTIFSRQQPRPSGTYTRRPHTPEPAPPTFANEPWISRPGSAPPSTSESNLKVSQPYHVGETDLWAPPPLPETAPYPSALPASSLPKHSLSSRHKPNFSFFGGQRSSSVRVERKREPEQPTSERPKSRRKKLVKKYLTQPTFKILNPSGEAKGQVDANGRAVAAKDVKAASVLGLQLAEAVAAIENGGANVKLARASENGGLLPKHTTAREEDEKSKLTNSEEDDKSDGDSPPLKRWSHAPLLPELDFGSSSSASGDGKFSPSPLFDPSTHLPPPKATINISALVSTKHPTTSPLNTNYPGKIPGRVPGKLTYRCDIHASNGASHRSVELACQKIVVDAGERLLDSYFYPGGFLYSLPPEVPEPITACEPTALEAKIEREGWIAFEEPRFNGLSLHPPGGRLGGSGEGPASGSAMTEGLKARREDDSRFLDAWVESQGVDVKLETAERISEETVKGGAVRKPDIATPSRKTTLVNDIETPTATPSRKATLVKSLETIRRRASGARTLEKESNKSTPSKKSAQNPGTNNSENRYTVVMDTFDSDSGSSGSGSEEWESVRSEFDSRSAVGVKVALRDTLLV